MWWRKKRCIKEERKIYARMKRERQKKCSRHNGQWVDEQLVSIEEFNRFLSEQVLLKTIGGKFRGNFRWKNAFQKLSMRFQKISNGQLFQKKFRTNLCEKCLLRNFPITHSDGFLTKVFRCNRVLIFPSKQVFCLTYMMEHPLEFCEGRDTSHRIPSGNFVAF